MDYIFHFGDVFRYSGELIDGTLTTLRLALWAMVLGLTVATGNAMVRTLRIPVVDMTIAVYVEVIRNTPLLVQAYLIFFGLPALGIRMNSETAAVVALVLNVGAYSTEILRAGVEAVPSGQVEAGSALGLRPGLIFRKIILPQALKIVFPALGSQFIMILLATSLMSAISTPELTSITNSIQSQTFRSFEAYVVSAIIYLALTIFFFGVFEFVARNFLGSTLINRMEVR